MHQWFIYWVENGNGDDCWQCRQSRIIFFCFLALFLSLFLLLLHSQLIEHSTRACNYMIKSVSFWWRNKIGSGSFKNVMQLIINLVRVWIEVAMPKRIRRPIQFYSYNIHIEANPALQSHRPTYINGIWFCATSFSIYIYIYKYVCVCCQTLKNWVKFTLESQY